MIASFSIVYILLATTTIYCSGDCYSLIYYSQFQYSNVTVVITIQHKLNEKTHVANIELCQCLLSLPTINVSSNNTYNSSSCEK
jgi:hypothetical protein